MKSMAKIMKILYLMCLSSTFGLQTSKPCRLRKFDAGYVCVCTSDYCDTLNLPELSNENEWMLVTSTQSGQRFNFSLGNFKWQHDRAPETISNEIRCEINRNVLHHEVIGFGGSITGAVSYLLNKLSSNLRECIYQSYYTNGDGLGYTLMRMPIGGCDFDLSAWVYNEIPENDFKLSNFTQLHPVDVLRTTLIKELMNATHNFDIKIVGVAWSSPRWMKAKGEWPGKNDNRLKVEFYQTWADYHLRWLDLMENAKIPIWAISSGNEPNFAHFTPFMGLNWRASEQAKWIAENLGPTIAKSKHAAVQIHTFDDNRDILLPWLHELNSSAKDALDYISAIAVHGYFDNVTSPTILDHTKVFFPNKSLLYTEICFGTTGPLSQVGPTLGSWQHFEELTDMLFETLMHEVNGFMDWNIILDIDGGPNYINNFVDAMIIVNIDEMIIYKQPLFYAMAHFSRFILPGSRRIEMIISGDNVGNVSSLAFLRPDHKVAAIFYNKNEQNTIALKIIDKFKGIIDIQIKPKSLNSLIYST